jgi:glycerol-3-phosphate acyltransferase PlsX
VSAGPTGATLAAALFTLGRIPGVTRPAVAVSIPAAAGPVLLVDAGGNVDCRPDLLLQFALTGASLFTVRHGVHDPRVGLLNIGSERGKGDAVRKQTYELLADAPLSFVGNVEPAAVMAGGVADVVVADGFSGNVLLKALEAMHARLRGVVAASGSAETLASVDALSPDRGAGFVLGVDGTVVVGHGAAGPRAVASYVAAAAAAVRAGLLPRLTEVMGALVRRRRDLAGLA